MKSFSSFRSAWSIVAMIVARVSLLSVASDAPDFCRGLDCPRYSVVNSVDGVELRDYEKTAWVSTRVEEADFGEAKTIALTRLDRYNFGYNIGDHLMAQTTPIIVEMTPNATGYQTSFFIEFEYQASPPVPSSPDVFIDVHPETQVYVSSFGGFPNKGDIAAQAKKLFENLQAKGIDVDTSKYIFAAYDSPFVTTNRHNEIWVTTEETPTITVV